jgi:hypothetical protein
MLSGDLVSALEEKWKNMLKTRLINMSIGGASSTLLFMCLSSQAVSRRVFLHSLFAQRLYLRLSSTHSC